MISRILAASAPLAFLIVGCNEEPKPVTPSAAPTNEVAKRNPSGKGPAPSVPQKASTKQTD